MNHDAGHLIGNTVRNIQTLSAIGLVAVALGACGSDSSGEQMPNTPLPTATTPLPERAPQMTAPERTVTAPDASEYGLSAEDCSFRSVQPGEYFSESKRDDLEADLGFLAKLQNKDEEIKFRDLLIAGGIVRKSNEDPLYAEAIVIANDDIEKGKSVTVDGFLATDIDQPRQCDDSHIEKGATRDQIHQTISIIQTISGNLGERAANNASRLAAHTYNTFTEELDAFKARVQDQR